MRRAWLPLLMLVALAGCGKATEMRERDVVVRGDGRVEAPEAPERPGRGVQIATARIVFVTHGQASDQFWTVVKRGITEARRQSGAAVSYRAPDSFSIDRMRRFIEDAIADRPDGLVVSLPDPQALGPTIRKAVDAGINVVTINSGTEAFKSLGVLAHVGQPEFRAGRPRGRRMARAGVRNALCVNPERGNRSLDDRCRGFAAGLREHGGSSRVLTVAMQDPRASQRRIAAALASDDIDGILTQGPGVAEPAIAAVRASSLDAKVRLATFDLSVDVLEAVRNGRMLFAVDQQPYLQGYLPVMLLAEKARHGLFPSAGELIPTGPLFITQREAPEVIRLAEEGIR
jgi:simple sugar transport system substrate-binding protein